MQTQNLANKGVDLTTTTNQSSSVELEVSESTNEQDIDLTGKANLEISSEE